MKDRALGNAFLDIALAGAVLTVIGLIIDIVGGSGIYLPLLAAAVITNGAYLIGALRLGVSPLTYLRTVGKRTQ